MTSKSLSTVTNELITSYGNTAKNVISAYRVGNERAVGYVNEAWVSAVAKAGPRLNSEVRNNALSAQKKVASYYVQGITLTSDGAEVVVNRAVELVGKGVEQVAANASRFEKSTGVTALNVLADAAVPAAVAVTQVVAKLEARSVQLVNKIAGSKAKVKVAAVKRNVVKRTAAKKAAPRARKAA